MSGRPRVVVHAHFYQPQRIDPFTGRMPPDPTAAPFRDWAARVTQECYRPIAERDTLDHASWDVGPTLTSYLAASAPDVLAGFAAADRRGGGAAGGPGIAQAFHHAILPLAAAHDRRTEVAWGIRDFEVRFGRRPSAMWLPEAAVDMPTLGTLAEAGVGTTILAPWQADVDHLARSPYRVDAGDGRDVTVMFYDADLSGSVSFDPAVTADADRFARERIAPRLTGAVADTGADGPAPMLVIATDGELYGHHQKFRDLFLDRLVAPDVAIPDRGFDIVTLAGVASETEGHAHPAARVRERTSWSCHHGVLRWSGECPCARDGRWKAPLRAALERLAGGIDAITERLGRDLTGSADIWAARDAYVDVVIGVVGAEAFAAGRLGAGRPAEERRLLMDLLEAQRWRLAMFASDGWYWEDPWRPETRQVLRCAARAARLVDGLTDAGLEGRLVADLETLVSPEMRIDGAEIYRRALGEVGQPARRE